MHVYNVHMYISYTDIIYVNVYVCHVHSTCTYYVDNNIYIM